MQHTARVFQLNPYELLMPCNIYIDLSPLLQNKTIA